MIYIYGDSHSEKNFLNLTIPFTDCHQNSITMHRIGRDNCIINFTQSNDNDTIILCSGEIDCRCHIQKQINLGRNEDEVIKDLIESYFKTIKNVIKVYKNIIIVAIIPPVEQQDYENINGPIKHEFPFVGSDLDRVRFTKKMNELLLTYCLLNSFIFFDPFSYYTRSNGHLKYELSDRIVHIGDNSYLLEQFKEMLSNIKNV